MLEIENGNRYLVSFLDASLITLVWDYKMGFFLQNLPHFTGLMDFPSK